MLEGLDVLILDALRFEPHPTHFTLSQALEVVGALRPRRTFLTHLSHTFRSWTDGGQAAARVALAYDGLAVEF